MAVAAPAPAVLGDYVARTRVATVALVLGGAAFVGISAQVAIPLPFTPVPLTLQTFAVLLVGAALGTWRGIASMVVYAAAGTAGVPWFSAGSSGWGGASYGYILGFIVAADPHCAAHRRSHGDRQYRHLRHRGDVFEVRD